MSESNVQSEGASPVWKIRLGEQPGQAVVEVGGVDISRMCSGLSVDVVAREMPVVTLSILPWKVADFVLEVGDGAVMALAGGAQAVLSSWVDALSVAEIDQAMIDLEQLGGLALRRGEAIKVALANILEADYRDHADAG